MENEQVSVVNLRFLWFNCQVMNGIGRVQFLCNDACIHTHTGELKRELNECATSKKPECKRVFAIAFGGKLTATKQPNDKRHFNIYSSRLLKTADDDL